MQIIEYKTSRIDEFNTLLDSWVEGTRATAWPPVPCRLVTATSRAST
jgi:hypothetical protein